VISAKIPYKSMTLLWHRLSPGAVLTMLASAMVAFGHGSIGAFGSTLGFIGAALFVCFLPGYFIFSELGSANSTALPERWVVAVGFSLFIVGCLCTLALTMHLHIQIVAIALMIVIGFAALWQAIRGCVLRPAVSAVSVPLRWTALLAWITCSAAAYAVGHGDVTASPGDNLLSVGIADALRTAVRPEEAFYISGVNPVYPFPSIHYVYALIASIADTSALFVFEKMRLIWTATGLASLFVGVRALSRNDGYAYFALLGGSILVVAGPLGAVPALYWGQLSGTSHPADVAMSVIAPIALVSLFTFLSSERRRRLDLLVLFSCMAILLAEVHQRECVEVLVYLGSAIAVMLIARDRLAALSLALAGVVPALSAWFYLRWVTHEGPGLGAIIGATRSALFTDLRALTLRTAFRPLFKYVILYDFTLLYGLNGLMLLVAGFVLVFHRNNTAVRTAGLGTAAFLLASSFAVLTIPILFATYSELLMSPFSRVAFVVCCLFWIGIAMLARSISALTEKRRPAVWPIVIVVGLGVASSGVLACLAHVLVGGPSSVDQAATGIIPAELLALVCSVLGLIAFIWPNPIKISETSQHHLSIAASLAIIGSLALATFLPATSFLTVLWRGEGYGTRSGAMDAMYRHYAGTSSALAPGTCVDKMIESLGHKVLDRVCMPSPAVIESINAVLNPKAILLVDPFGVFAPIGLVRARLAGPVLLDSYIDWGASFPRYREIVARSLDKHGGAPFFAIDETPDERYADARALGVTHVLASPSERNEVIAAVKMRPDLFEVLLDETGWQLVKIKQAAAPVGQAN
jgi:hypothetical protein